MEEEWNIFVRWENNLWSFYVLLRTLENNNTPQQKHMNNWKAPSVINLMGFAYFASLAESRQKKSHGIWKKKSGYKTHSEVRLHVKTDIFLQNTLVMKTWRFEAKDFLKNFFFNSCILRLNVKIINQIISHNVLVWPLSHFSFTATVSP